MKSNDEIQKFQKASTNGNKSENFYIKNPNKTDRCQNKMLHTSKDRPPFKNGTSLSQPSSTTAKSTFIPKEKVFCASHSAPKSPTNSCKISRACTSTSTSTKMEETDKKSKVSSTSTKKSESEPSSPRRKARVLLRQTALENSKESLNSDKSIDNEHKNNDHQQEHVSSLIRMENNVNVKGRNLIPNKEIKTRKKDPGTTVAVTSALSTNKVTIHNCIRNDNNNNYNNEHDGGMANTQTNRVKTLLGTFAYGNMSRDRRTNDVKMKKVEREIKMIEIVEEQSKVMVTNMRRRFVRDNKDSCVGRDSINSRQQVVLKPLNVSSSTNKRRPHQPPSSKQDEKQSADSAGIKNINKLNESVGGTQIATASITVNPASSKVQLGGGHKDHKLINRETTFFQENGQHGKNSLKNPIKLNEGRSVTRSVFSKPGGGGIEIKLQDSSKKFIGKAPKIESNTVSSAIGRRKMDLNEEMDHNNLNGQLNGFNGEKDDGKSVFSKEGERQRDVEFIRTLQPNLEILEGSDLELSVQIKGAKKVIWVKNDKVIPNIPPDFEYKSNSTDGAYSLRVKDAFVEDSGLYICEAYGSDEESDAICWCRVDVIEDAIEDEIDTSIEEIEDIPTEHPPTRRDFIVPVIITTSSDAAEISQPLIMSQPQSPAAEKRLHFRGIRDASAESSREVFEDALENIEDVNNGTHSFSTAKENQSNLSEQGVDQSGISFESNSIPLENSSVDFDKSTLDDISGRVGIEQVRDGNYDHVNQNETSSDEVSNNRSRSQGSAEMSLGSSFIKRESTEEFVSFLHEDVGNLSFSPNSTSTEIGNNVNEAISSSQDISPESSSGASFVTQVDNDTGATQYSGEMSISKLTDESTTGGESPCDIDRGRGVTHDRGNLSSESQEIFEVDNLKICHMSVVSVSLEKTELDEETNIENDGTHSTKEIVEETQADIDLGETQFSEELSISTINTTNQSSPEMEPSPAEESVKTQYTGDLSFGTISEFEEEEGQESLQPIMARSIKESHSKSFMSQSSTESGESDAFRSSSVEETMSPIESPNGTCGSGSLSGLNLIDNRPKILMGTSNLIAILGEDVNLRVKMQAMDEANTTVRWCKFVRGVYRRLGFSSDSGSEEETPHIQMARVNSELITLKINDVNYEDSGKYRVKIQNAYGTDYHSCVLSVEGPPEPPSTPPKVNYDENTNSILVSWSSCIYDGGSAVTGYCLEASLIPVDGDLTNHTDKWTLITPPSFKWLCFTMPNPKSSYTYKFRVSVENAYGKGKPSNPSVELAIPLNSGSTSDDKDGSRYPDRKISIFRDDELEPVSYEYKDVRLKKESFLEHYDKFEQLGKGRFGVVFKVTSKSTKKSYAGKFVKCIKAKDKERAQLEYKIMNELKYHPKLICLVDAFEMSREIVIVTEMINGGELFERVVADDFTLTENDCITFLRQICNGVTYIHEKNIMHLDLKPENILCTTKTSNQIKIIDFGLAQHFNPNEPIRVLFGTAEFVSPEIINYDTICPATDMWSIGVITYILLSGLSPFLGENDNETFSNITRGEFDFEDEAFEQISEDAKDFISSLILKRKEKRLTATQCLEHKWLALSDAEKKDIVLPTDKLKRFLVRRKWQKTGNAIRALGRITTLYSSRRSSSSTSSTPSTSASPMGSSLNKSISTHDSVEYDSVFGSVDVPMSPDAHQNVNNPLRNLSPVNSTITNKNATNCTVSESPSLTSNCGVSETLQNETNIKPKYNDSSRSDSGICDVASTSSTPAPQE